MSMSRSSILKSCMYLGESILGYENSDLRFLFHKIPLSPLWLDVDFANHNFGVESRKMQNVCENILVILLWKTT